MRLAKNAFFIALTMLAMLVAMSAQTLRSATDPRNPAPTVGTGGPEGGPTGLFTIYDGQTLRRGEFTFSAAYSNFDRDPGDVDIVDIPLSFQVGLSDHVELFFNTNAYRQIHVNSPRNLSSFYLPNSRINGISPAAIIQCPQGSAAATTTGACFRPAGTQAFAQFPFTGASLGGFGFTQNTGSFAIGQQFGFGFTNNPTTGPPIQSGGEGADNFPGVGSNFGGILPGVVLQTASTGGASTTPVVYTLQPSYLPDAPFVNRTFGETSFNSFTVGAKIRFTGPANPVGIGLIPFYRFYADQADDGFNQMQRGSGPGAGGWNPFGKNRGDVGLIMFADARLRRWVNVSGNIGYIYTSSVKADINGTEFTLLDRRDEVLYGVGLDFPVNRYFQPILEFRGTKYVGGATPNAFENDPMDGIAGVRFFPTRWFGFGLAYRHHFNQQDQDSIEDVQFSQNVQGRAVVFGAGGTTNAVTLTNTTSTGSIANVFRPSTDPHGFIVQLFAGHRNARGQADVPNQPANVTAVAVDRTSVVLPCPPGTSSRSGACGDVQTVGVRTTAVDPEGDVLTYSYTVSGGRIVGQGANVSWDLTGVRPGTYTITSAVDDGCGFCGTPQTTTITVTECTDCVAPPPVERCECPTISVTGPSGSTQPGETMTFTANVSGGTQSSVTYNWSVNQGSIVEGQGTPVIRVATTNLNDTSVTATVTVGGLPACNCEGTASETGIVARLAEARETELGPAPADEIKQRVDQFFSELAADPSARGVIINYGTDREVARRERDIRSAITFRQYPADRVTFVRGGTQPGIRTRFFIVPAGAAEPQP